MIDGIEMGPYTWSIFIGSYMMQRADLMLRLIVYLITRIGSDINPKQIMLGGGAELKEGDRAIQSASRSGILTCAASWEELRTKYEEVPWQKLIWFQCIFLSMHLSAVWHSRTGFLQEIGCCNWVIPVTLPVSSAEYALNARAISFFNALSPREFGGHGSLSSF